MDAALCDITGAPPRLTARIVHAMTQPYTPEIRRRILEACQPETSSSDKLCVLNVDLAEAFAAVILALLKASGHTSEQVDLIGSHGQTVWHNVLPDGRVNATLQIVEASVIAERTGITTVSNFRARDVAAGGQGAPLTGYVDWLLLRHETRWRAIQNIGGMSNVTFLPPLSEDALPPGQRHVPTAFDTGPGNALMDAAVEKLTGGVQTYDDSGGMAERGHIDEDWLGDLMSRAYFERQPPKTTGRELFGTAMALELIETGQSRGLSPADIVATLTMLTAASIADAYQRFAPTKMAEVILGGGGRHNATLVNMLQSLLPESVVRTHEDIGIASDHKEALVFAVLAYETWHNRPGTLPTLTGAQSAAVLGQITPGKNYAHLLRKTWV